MTCTKCGQPKAEALPGGTCDHVFPGTPVNPAETDADEAMLATILHGAYPSALATMRLQLEQGELDAIQLATPQGAVTVTGTRLAEMLDVELSRRWEKAAHGKGKGT